MSDKVMRITVETPPDPRDEGRQRFVMEWTDPDDGRVRGQYFKAHLNEHIVELHARGWRVEVVERLDS